AHQRAQAGASEVRGENLQPWSDLRQTYRISNRRAADHIPIKLLSADYVFVPGNGIALPEEDDFAADADELERLAALEHRSWEIGRRLDGWKAGATRDDRRRINPALGIPYADLSEPVKELDRVQVRTIASALKGRDDGEVALRDFPIGLIGHNRVSTDEKERIVEALRSRLTTLLANQPKRHYSLLTPLAPGSDTILTEEALRLFAEAAVPHRLVVVRTLPRDAMIADFIGTLADGGEWRLAPRADDPASSDPAVLLSGHLDTVMATADRTIVANLVPTGLELADWLSGKERRQDAYRRANAYIVDRCRLIMAFRDRARPSRPGGTGEALSWARGEAVPTAFRDVVRDRQVPAPQVIELTDANAAATPSPATDAELEQAASND
ncbi:MAG: RyR domain-containing protein, partial [Pseudomonadota bacterium]